MNLGDNLWLIIIAMVVIAIIAFLLLRPRQRVQLSEPTPLRPHMIDPKPEAEGRGLDGEAAAATSDVVGEIIRAPVREYDPAKGPAIYRDRSWPKPSGPPVAMTIDEADRIPLAMDITEPQLFRAGEIEATITPRTLTRADIFVLRMIKDSPNRPLYFSRTSGGYGQELGLGPYLLTQGLARKLMPTIPTPGRDTLLLPGEGFIDVARTRALWFDVFKGQQAIIRKGDWVDSPSVGIPALYVSTGIILSEVLRSRGQGPEAQRVLATAEQVARATRLGDVFAQSTAPPIPLEGDSRAQVPLPLSPAESIRRP